MTAADSQISLPSYVLRSPSPPSCSLEVPRRTFLSPITTVHSSLLTQMRSCRRRYALCRLHTSPTRLGFGSTGVARAPWCPVTTHLGLSNNGYLDPMNPPTWRSPDGLIRLLLPILGGLLDASAPCSPDA